MGIVLNSNWFSLLIPVAVIYMAKYYTLKHDYEHIVKEYSKLHKSAKVLLDSYIELIEKRDKNE